MPTPTIRKRSEIPAEYTWNAPSVFASPAEWEAEADDLQKNGPSIARFKGRLGESPAVLLEALQAHEDLYKRAGKVLQYAFLSQAADATDPLGGQMAGRARALMGQLTAAASYFDPELLAIGQENLTRWMEQEPGLKIYAHHLDNLFRQGAHIRSVEVEELLGMLTAPFRGVETTADMLTDGDFRFKNAKSSSGEEFPVTQGTLRELLASTDRETRRTAWQGYYDTYLDFKNTLASNLSTAIRQNVFMSRARKHSGTLEARLFENNIPVEVFHNLIDTFQRNLPTWHRYWEVRRKILGVDRLAPYDIWAPLTDKPLSVPFKQAVDWVSAALAPLGEDYVNSLRRGALQQRWIDVYPSQGKASSQFSYGWPGTFPFIFLNYDDTIFSVSTLAHELGHSMHSYLTWENQPFVYSHYSLFVAEVASNFHQAMLRGYLLANFDDPLFQINVIEEAMNNFHRYFFIMPTLARFELEMHERAERGEGLTAETMNERMTDLFAEGYGDKMDMERERTGVTWATFSHLYNDYYVYQYATGISAANALSSRILAGEPGAVERYLGFLKSGSSKYPLEVLQQAGVDLTRPEPVEQAFQVLSGLVDRLEKLAK